MSYAKNGCIGGQVRKPLFACVMIQFFNQKVLISQRLQVDASAVGLGVILAQEIETEERPVYVSEYEVATQRNTLLYSIKRSSSHYLGLGQPTLLSAGKELLLETNYLAPTWIQKQ